jgi:hypothetical protein
MLWTLLMLPFRLLRKAACAVLFIVKIVMAIGAGIFRFIFGRRVGTIIAAVGIFLLGKKILQGRMQSREKKD